MNIFNKKVGESVEIEMNGYGGFSATLQKIEGNLYTFMFDNCIARRAMNLEDGNKGGYEKSDMEQYLNTDVFNAFPEDIRRYIQAVTLATAGQIFGHDDEWCNKYLKMDNNEQFPLMEKRQNRIAFFDNDASWWWLQNTVKTERSSANFALVTNDGNASSHAASTSRGVRPIFMLLRPTSRTTVEFLMADISTKKKEIKALESKINQLKRNKWFDEPANEMKAMMDSYIRAGFTKEQAFRMVLELSIAIIGGKR